ncbi:MAG TPA: 4-alpha-glucanotransferase, partial [Usitatibacteraceae bacterium]|nr:4-alpha-glucanotransferase [Usitatibacteraceae bacterium]
HARDGFQWRKAVDTALPGVAPAALVDEAHDALAARAVAVLVEEAQAAPPRRQTGIEPDVLDRLSLAAGIARTWHDVAGTEHVVGDDTRRALLAAMRLDATSTGQARERLHELAAARECRHLPRVIVLHERGPLRIPLAANPSQAGPGILRIVASDGEVRRTPFDPAHGTVDRVVACDGRTVARHLVALPPLPEGTYTVSVEGEPLACRLVVAPRRCFLPSALLDGKRRFGLAAHLYALRRPGDQGIGDFTALAQAAEATARAGGSLVGINPLHALFAAQRDRASPYHPSDRRFLEALYIDVAAIPDLADSDVARRALEQHMALLGRRAAQPAVDYAVVWAGKRPVLEACFEAFSRRPAGDALAAEYGRFVADGGERLRRFAAYEAIAATRPGVPWQRWPGELRRPDDPGVARFAARHAREVDFAMYLQWLADRQFGQAARSARAAGLGIGFYRDLAIGAAPDGAEAWDTQATLAHGASVGAPPDPFCAEGQVWSLPPPLPEALAAEGYEGFRTLIAGNARHAGALRIDHVMGLSRLFWVPDGATAADGAYVRYPLDDLLGVLALESRRAHCLIVGEDLGTVAEGLRERLDSAGVLSYRVLWFERDGAQFRGPQRYPAKAAACISTHDLPTIRGWWDGADIDERRALGLAGDDETATARATRIADRNALMRAMDAAGVSAPAAELAAGPEVAVAQALHRFIGATPCALALIQADDLAGETSAPNLPGTDRERPNWRRRLAVDAGNLWATPIGAQAARDLAPARGTAT